MAHTPPTARNVALRSQRHRHNFAEGDAFLIDTLGASAEPI